MRSSERFDASRRVPVQILEETTGNHFEMLPISVLKLVGTEAQQQIQDRRRKINSTFCDRKADGFQVGFS